MLGRAILTLTPVVLGIVAVLVVLHRLAEAVAR